MQLLAHAAVLLFDLEGEAARHPLGKANKAFAIFDESGRVAAFSLAGNLYQNLSIQGCFWVWPSVCNKPNLRAFSVMAR